jgi:hypothetical protein
MEEVAYGQIVIVVHRIVASPVLSYVYIQMRVMDN